MLWKQSQRSQTLRMPENLLMKGHVSYEHVSFHYSDDNTPVLSDISIDIPAGKSVALVGPSGGGKTTICSLLPRFYDVTEDGSLLMEKISAA